MMGRCDLMLNASSGRGHRADSGLSPPVLLTPSPPCPTSRGFIAATVVTTGCWRSVASAAGSARRAVRGACRRRPRTWWNHAIPHVPVRQRGTEDHRSHPGSGGDREDPAPSGPGASATASGAGAAGATSRWLSRMSVEWSGGRQRRNVESGGMDPGDAGAARARVARARVNPGARRRCACGSGTETAGAGR